MKCYVSTNDTARSSKLAQGNLCTTGDHSINKHQTTTPTPKRKREVQLSNVDYLHTNTRSKQVQGDLSTSPTRKKIPGKIDDLNNVDFVSSNVNAFRQEALLYVSEDNEAVIKMIIKVEVQQ